MGNFTTERLSMKNNPMETLEMKKKQWNEELYRDVKISN